MMFWRRRKLQQELQTTTSVSQLAGWLGVERRYAVRIKCPAAKVTLLPIVKYQDRHLTLHDLSVGGCCLLDAQEIMGASIGNDVHLVLQWPDGAVSVHGRIVSRVDDKRHIQFLNLPQARANAIKAVVALGSQGQALKSSLETVQDGPTLAAREIWSSPHGDTVIVEDDLHRMARFKIGEANYTFFKQAWPVKENNVQLSEDELSVILIFLCNIPQPSELLRALTAHIEGMA